MKKTAAPPPGPTPAAVVMFWREAGPDRWFRKLTGEAVVNLQSARVDRFDPVTAEVDRKASELLARCWW